MKVSFEGIGENIVTFYNSKTNPAAAGVSVKMSAACEAAKCAGGVKTADAGSEFLIVDVDVTNKVVGFIL